MKFNLKFRMVFQSLVCFAMFSGCAKQKFETENSATVATNLNQFLSLSQADRSTIISQIGYECGYTSPPIPVEGTNIIGATVVSGSTAGSTGQYWLEPRLCLPVCWIFPMDEGGVVYGSVPAQTNLQISIASLVGSCKGRVRPLLHRLL